MMPRRRQFPFDFLLLCCYCHACCKAWSIDGGVGEDTTILLSRRRAFVTSLSTAATAFGAWQRASYLPARAAEEEGSSVVVVDYSKRDRKGNKDAVIREDYWYMTGKLPPRLLEAELQGADPQWNAFGTCETASGSSENSCTYVSLKQRIPAYTKYGSSIAYGAAEYKKLGQILRDLQLQSGSSSSSLWEEARTYLATPVKTTPPPVVDAETKMVLFATAMLTSPNFPIPGKDLLVARFYANEARYAATAMLDAVEDRDAPTALGAWEFGKDSWNSYFKVVNRAVVPKVGDKFEPIV